MSGRTMPIVPNVLTSYWRGPGVVMRRLLALGPREDRALVYLMCACLIMFACQLPRIERQAHMAQIDAGPDMAAAALGWMMIAPLALYLIAPVTRLIGMLLGGRGSWFGARLALFWALLAAAPVAILQGLIAGFVGLGTEHTGIGMLWLAVFFWFWLGGAYAQERAA